MTLMVKKIGAGQFQFVLLTRNGRLVAAAETGTPPATATDLIAAIRRHADFRRR